MNNPLENHDRIKTRWEPKISRQLGAIKLQQSTTRQQPLLLPVSLGSGSKTLGGLEKAVYSKTSRVEHKAGAQQTQAVKLKPSKFERWTEINICSSSLK